MNTESATVHTGIVGKILAVLCLATFWALPFSPFVAIAAVSTTRHRAGWPRTVAKTGAVLSILCTGLLAALFLWILFVIFVLRGGDFAC